jgi:transcriptional regulator with GAF, ATPase, and Fis domain
MEHLCDQIALLAPRRCTVLITGETGTGKEIVAKALHLASPRAPSPMVAVNCTALPSNLIEAELFGHAKGAFTGAHATRVGRFEQAHRSSLFLDEVGDLAIDAQAKLLRVLQEQEVQRIGGLETIRIDVRVLAATNVDLEEAVAERRFREDLYYRLNVVPLVIPPLRERREDIPLLLEHFLMKNAAAENCRSKAISTAATLYLQTLEWPGNVRQLEHAVQRAFVLSGDRETLTVDDFQLPRKHGSNRQISNANRPFVSVSEQGLDFDAVVSDLERSLIEQALTLSSGNKARAADLLRIKRTTLLAKLKTLGLATAGAEPVETPLLKPGSLALVVDREEALRKTIADGLTAQGCKVFEAAEIDSALELFECWRDQLSLAVLGSVAESAAKYFAAYVPTIVIGEAHWNAGTLPGAAQLSADFSADQLLKLAGQLTAADHRARCA